MTCSHDDPNFRRHGQLTWSPLLERHKECQVDVCRTCGAWLSLGPANDDDPNVQIEIRAAEIAALADDYQRGIVTDETAVATTNIGGPKIDASWLARVIAEHEEIP